MMEPGDIDDPGLRDHAVAAARGARPFDLLITGGRVADVATGECREADIGVCGSLIASVHLPGTHSGATKVLDARGLIATPGLIDSHMHIESSMITPEIYCEAVLARGVTTVVWDPHEFGNVAGVEGIDYAIDCAARTKLRILPLAPSCVPSAPGFETAGADFTPDIIEDLLRRDEIMGLAEVMDMPAVISRADRMRAIVGAGLSSGKLVCGHARSLGGPDLQAYAASGISSDHEITSDDDLLEKIRAGLTIELRGSHPYLLPGFASALQRLPQMPPTVTLCSDDVFPDDLLATGGVDHVLRQLIGHGLDPMRALQAATLNAAIRLERRDLGHLAAGKRADIVLVDDLATYRAARVFRNGHEVHAASTRPKFPEAFLGTSRLDPFLPTDFRIAARGPQARLATIAKPRFTAWGEVLCAIEDGYVQLPEGATWMAVVNRHDAPTLRPKMGVLQGWGAWDGAFATTVSHDSHNLTVFGSDVGDMALAANAVVESGGGMAVASDGTVTAVLPLPVAGLVSDKPLRIVAAEFTTLREAAGKIVTWEPPYLSFKALVGATLACNAGPHLTDLGIADSASGILRATPVLDDGLR